MAGFLSLDLLRAHLAPCYIPDGRADTRQPLIAQWHIAGDGRLACRWLQMEGSVPVPAG